MKKTLTEEQKLRRKERAAARRAKKKEEKAHQKAEFDRRERHLQKIYIGKNLRNTDLELINYPFYTTSMNSEVKLDVDDNNIIRSVKLMRM